jgi:hypothetical protein
MHREPHANRTPYLSSIFATWKNSIVTAQDSLRLALKEVLGPNARVHGFKGSAPPGVSQILRATGSWCRSSPPCTVLPSD